MLSAVLPLGGVTCSNRSETRSNQQHTSAHPSNAKRTFGTACKALGAQATFPHRMPQSYARHHPNILANTPRPPNYPLIYPKYLLLRAIRAPLKGHWGVLAVAASSAAVVSSSSSRISTRWILDQVGAQSSIVEARKLEHHSPHALKVKYKGS